MPHRFTSLLTHLIFSTKDRFPHLDRDLALDCHATCGNDQVPPLRGSMLWGSPYPSAYALG